MAEDDDVEAFGEFAFASFQSNSQFKKGANSLADNEDDEWGDFVESPQQSKSTDPSFTGHHVSDNCISPPPLMKRSGALPLSIFGDAEKEEKEKVDNFGVAGDSNPGKSSGITGDFSSTLVPKGISNSRNLSITDLYNRYSEIKPDDRHGPNSTGNVDSVENGVYSSSNQSAVRSAVTGLEYMDFNDTVGISDYSQLTNKSGNDEFSFKPYVAPGPNENGNLSGDWMQGFSGFSSDLKATTPSVQKSSSDLYMNGQRQQLDGSTTGINDDGDNGWEFKDAFSEFGTEDNKVDLMAHEVPERSAYSSGTESGSNKPLDLFGTSNGLINFFATSTESVDCVATTSGISSTFHEVGFIGIQSTNGFTSETNSFVEQNNIKDPLNDSTDDGSEEFDEDFGEFTAASAETGPKPEEFSTNANDAVSTSNSKIQVDLMVHEVSERSAYSSRNASSSNKSLELFETSKGSINFFFASSTSSDYFATSSGIPSASQEVDFIGVQPSIANRNGFDSEINSVIEQDNNKGLLNRSTDVGDAEFDDDFGEITAASAETGPKPGEKDTKVNYIKHSIPLTIFGNEQPESAGSSDVQDLFMHQSTSDQRNCHTPTRVISVNDLISSLYSEDEQTSFSNTVQKPSKTQWSSSDAASSSIIVNHADHLDDSSWSFKDASQKRVDIEASLCSNEDTSSNLKLNTYLDFYSRLKDELCFVAKCQFERLKQAQGNAALSGEDAAASSLDSEFQLVWKELEQMNVFYEENNQQDHHSGDTCLNGFVQVLLEPEFQILESEYHLSEKLLLVEKDLRSAMKLIRHTTTMLKILTIGTMEEQRSYISLWSEMISVCLEELKHGALIWNQAMKKHVQSQLLSEPQGRMFFWAIGEIYRVVVVLGASAKLFKPWTLLGSVDSPAMYILLEECHAVWSTSGLEEALSTVSAPSALDNTSLLKSIKHILGLDELKLQNYVFAEKESRCRLSILTKGVAPDLIRYAIWQEEKGVNGTLHIQGYAELSKPVRYAAFIKTLKDEPRAHCEKRRGTREQARDYCKKEESRQSGPYEAGEWTEGGQGSRNDVTSFKDAIVVGKRNRDLIEEFPNEMAKFPRFVNTVRHAVADEKARSAEWPHDVLFPWQEQLVEYLSGPVDPRKIVWYWDAQGGRGKTSFARHMANKGAFYTRGGKYSDVAYAFKMHMEHSIFDYTRDGAEYVNYGLLESIKDEFVVSSKYESCLVKAPIQHVIVLANFSPDTSKLSQDRWKVIDMSESTAVSTFFNENF